MTTQRETKADKDQPRRAADSGPDEHTQGLMDLYGEQNKAMEQAQKDQEKAAAEQAKAAETK